MLVANPEALARVRAAVVGKCSTDAQVEAWFAFYHPFPHHDTDSALTCYCLDCDLGMFDEAQRQGLCIRPRKWRNRLTEEPPSEHRPVEVPQRPAWLPALASRLATPGGD